MTDKTVAAFLKGRKAREDVVLATKVCGYSDRMTWMPREKPDTPTSLTKDQILYSVDASLKRLGTDYIVTLTDLFISTTHVILSIFTAKSARRESSLNILPHAASSFLINAASSCP